MTRVIVVDRDLTPEQAKAAGLGIRTVKAGQIITINGGIDESIIRRVLKTN